jgi:hypothetical protein
MRTKLSSLFLLVVFSVTAQTTLTLDTSYGNNGISTNSTISDRHPYRLLFEDNKFYGNGGIFSKNYDGSDNLGFGSNGSVYFHNLNETLTIKGAKAKNGFLYVFGNIKDDAVSLSQGFIIKISTAGILDSSFGLNGRASFNLVGYQTINDIEVTDSGSIFTTGSIRNTTAKMYLAKFTPTGILDTSFDPLGFQ